MQGIAPEATLHTTLLHGMAQLHCLIACKGMAVYKRCVMLSVTLYFLGSGVLEDMDVTTCFVFERCEKGVDIMFYMFSHLCMLY